MRKKGIPEALLRAVMSLYKGARTKEKVGTYFCEVCGIRWSTSGIRFIATVACH